MDDESRNGKVPRPSTPVQAERRPFHHIFRRAGAGVRLRKGRGVIGARLKALDGHAIRLQRGHAEHLIIDAASPCPRRDLVGDQLAAGKTNKQSTTTRPRTEVYIYTPAPAHARTRTPCWAAHHAVVF
ncbi:hypothetical protein GGTG_09676 [Gaeumannomyces tritici R3-111a-1]|uniref:Uncharacterized protein n=1 Tax=Gaeumannomyces tritici (strain R3-111a-1) TaxID=644352 RepID=J3P838_GAET3|nr:hypothetical protein GGTG_09676 [Gaeumannomyces tritici R3-111a-1]EJT72821.1 hypothetical protein GGTG_09676 [Gaeumannomyces tritici R3-111a-1]